MDFSKADFEGDVPEGICPTCARHGVHYAPTKTDIVYCVHNRIGAFRVLNRSWKTAPNIARHDFEEKCTRGLTKGELTLEVAQELREILEEQQARDATKH